MQRLFYREREMEGKDGGLKQKSETEGKNHVLKKKNT